MPCDITGEALLDAAAIQDPYPLYRQLQEQAPVYRIPGTDIFMVSSYQWLVDASTRTEDFSSAMHCFLYCGDQGGLERLVFSDEGIQMLATADPPIHALHKHTVFPALVAKRMALLEPEIVEVATQYVQQALARSSVDFMAEVGNLVPITVISRLIGFRNSDLQRLLQAAFDSTSMVGAKLTLPQLQKLMAGSSGLQSWIAEQLTIAEDEPGQDILTSINNGVQSGALNTFEAIVILQTLLAAGGESTTSLLGSAVRLLAERQDLQQQLRQQPDLIPEFVEEALRMESPFRHLMRYATKDTQLGGVDIPAGATVLLFWGAANRDPDEFESPAEFRIDRKPRRHVTFGRGIHQCIGAPLARLEAKVVLTVLLEQTASITLDPGYLPRWVDSLQVRRLERLPLQLIARS